MSIFGKQATIYAILTQAAFAAAQSMRGLCSRLAQESSAYPRGHVMHGFRRGRWTGQPQDSGRKLARKARKGAVGKAVLR